MVTLQFQQLSAWRKQVGSFQWTICFFTSDHHTLQLFKVRHPIGCINHDNYSCTSYNVDVVWCKIIHRSCLVYVVRIHSYGFVQRSTTLSESIAMDSCNVVGQHYTNLRIFTMFFNVQSMLYESTLYEAHCSNHSLGDSYNGFNVVRGSTVVGLCYDQLMKLSCNMPLTLQQFSAWQKKVDSVQFTIAWGSVSV